jgi:hypothetical protein
MHVQLNKKPKSQIGSDYHHEVETNKHISLEERAKKYGGKIEAGEEIEYGSALGREKW